MKSGSLSLLEPLGSVSGLYRDCFNFAFTAWGGGGGGVERGGGGGGFFLGGFG